MQLTRSSGAFGNGQRPDVSYLAVTYGNLFGQRNYAPMHATCDLSLTTDRHGVLGLPFDHRQDLMLNHVPQRSARCLALRDVLIGTSLSTVLGFRAAMHAGAA